MNSRKGGPPSHRVRAGEEHHGQNGQRRQATGEHPGPQPGGGNGRTQRGASAPSTRLTNTSSRRSCSGTNAWTATPRSPDGRSPLRPWRADRRSRTGDPIPPPRRARPCAGTTSTPAGRQHLQRRAPGRPPRPGGGPPPGAGSRADPRPPAARGRARPPGRTWPPPRPAGGSRRTPWCPRRSAAGAGWRMSRMPPGSSPLVGSSSTRSSGAPSSASAMPSRCRIPWLYFLTRFAPASVRSTVRSTSSIRRGVPADPRPARSSREALRFSRPDRYPQKAAPHDRPPRAGAPLPGRPLPRTAAGPGSPRRRPREDQSEQHADGRGLPGPVRARESRRSVPRSIEGRATRPPPRPRSASRGPG
jgi:hypothetical protein